MAENVHQGWLYTRDGEKFAPITLIDDVLALNGKKYKEVVSGQINDLKTYVDTFVGTINTKNNEQDNQIAALQTVDTNFAEKMSNFDASDSDALYITDKNNNVIAYINENGVHSIDFTMPNDGISLADFHSKYENFVSATNTTLANLTARLANFNGEDSDTLYIIDKNDNVIAYINDTGVQSMNFTTPEGNLNATISGLTQEIKDREALDATLTPKVEANTVAIAAHEQAVNQKLANFNGEDSDKLFIIDKNDNVIAYINDVGVHSLNFYSVSTDLEATLTKINQEIIDRGNAIDGLKSYVDTQDATVTAAYTEADSIVTKAFGDADAVLKEEIINAYEAADTEVINAYKAADNKVREEYAAADAGLKTYVDTENQNIKNLLVNFNGEDSDKLFIVDKNDNVIAYINEVGVHSLNFYSVNTDLEATLAKINQEIINRGDAISEVKSYVDTQDATVTAAYKAADAAVTTAFGEADAVLRDEITEAYEAADAEVTKAYKAADAEVTKAYKAADESLKSYVDTADQGIKNLLVNFDGSDSEKLFIIDKNDNVIAYIDSAGIHSINLYSENYDFETIIPTIRGEVTAEANARAAAITNLKSYVDTQDSAITKAYKAADTTLNANLTKAYKAADTTLNTNLTKAYQEADTKLSTDLTKAYQDADISVKSYVDTQDNAITKAYKEADAQLSTDLTKAYQEADVQLSINLTKAYEAADTQLSTDLTEAYKAADTSLKSHVDTSDGKIREDFAAADDVVRSEFAAADTALKTSLEGKISAVNGRVTAEAGARVSADNNLAKRIDTSNVNIAANASELSGRLGNIDSNTHTNAFYIIDKNDNTIAIFDSLGLRTTNVTLQNGKSAQVNGIYFSKVDKTIQLTLS